MPSSVPPRSDTSRPSSFLATLSRRQCQTASALRVMRITRSEDSRELRPSLYLSTLRALFARVVSEGRGVMCGPMMVCRDQFEILRRVIQSVAVAMMNFLGPTEPPAKDGRHDHSMFEVMFPDAITFNPHSAIAIRTDVSGHARIVANPRVYARSSQ